uniref:Uncharacterized protein n=1 Tax=Solanum lycopersicum TaxID=4081 RepID=K4CJW4_SOLLC
MACPRCEQLTSLSVIVGKTTVALRITRNKYFYSIFLTSVILLSSRKFSNFKVYYSLLLACFISCSFADIFF